MSYTANIGLATQSVGATGWAGPLNENFTELDGIASIGGLGVQTTEVPSATLNIKIAAGFFVNNQGILTSYAGISSTAMVTASTNYVYLNNAGVLQVNQSGFPSSPTVYVPIATVAAGATTITAITDSRSNLIAVGGALGTGGGTVSDGAVYSVGATSGMILGSAPGQVVAFGDGVNCAIGVTTGTMIGKSSSSKLSVFGATPSVQSVFGSMVASSSWTTVEQSMLNSVWVALRKFGIGS